MANAATDSAKKSPTTLLSLPQELQDDILDQVLFSTNIHINEGARHELPRDGPWDPFSNSDMACLADLPYEIASLKLVCHQFANTVGKKWHSKVTYLFPSTISFVDILKQWPAARVSALRYAYVRDYEFTVTFGSFGTGMHISGVLCLFPGLQLDTLTVENMALAPSGESVANGDGGYDLTEFNLMRLPFTNGWKTLEYVSGPLSFLPSQQREFEAKLAQHKIEKEEADLQVEILGKMRPHIRHLADLRQLVAEGIALAPRPSVQLSELEEWYSKHPEAGNPGEFSEEKKAKEVTVRVRRGDKADCVQDGSGLDGFLMDRLVNSNWAELRKGDDKVVDDSVNLPFRHRAEQLK
ncbi:hypothetical protein PRZ48_007831 [Zasmidium cellare]|uniref:F-box domain-containing protein n=1 Tax=Zasmidium cellare TaxID=395010 RepID=A0ABR0ELH6_ZASCE|nr:hypothetical protein PRZ48_007831 [Zasmidium cellare]